VAETFGTLWADGRAYETSGRPTSQITRCAVAPPVLTVRCGINSPQPIAIRLSPLMVDGPLDEHPCEIWFQSVHRLSGEMGIYLLIIFPKHVYRSNPILMFVCAGSSDADVPSDRLESNISIISCR